jgi:hypothetical protein
MGLVEVDVDAQHRSAVALEVECAAAPEHGAEIILGVKPMRW